MKIDQLLSEAVADPAYRQAQDRWLSPESVQRYRAELDRFYRQRARPADPRATRCGADAIPGTARPTA
ncbi:Uncharacterised protein [Chromobacterium violaceum]|uniref:Uncharacterized protein n=1 Tax=Chromobacterium violaceum TaxID=536 RepID=A0A447TE45_CHRVL|nr:Uncharacterised protein [Chromobacterium violaceum]